MGISDGEGFLATTLVMTWRGDIGFFGVGLWVVGSGGSVLGKAASETVNVAIVGVGGRGRAHVSGIPAAGGKIVALGDLDDNNLAAAAKEHEGASSSA